MDAREGRYGCTRGPIMGFESRAISARVTKQIVTIFSKTCDKNFLSHFFYIYTTFLRLLKYCAQFKSKFRIQIESITLA